MWTNTGGIWSYTTKASADGNTTWVFKDLASQSNCYDQLMTASEIAGFPVEKDEQMIGLLITAIDGVENNDPQISGGERAWQFLVDEVYANRSCREYPIVDGSEVVWRYMTNQFG